MARQNRRAERHEQQSKRGRRAKRVMKVADGGNSARGHCPVTRKRQWVSRSGAEKAARDQWGTSHERRLRAYLCTECRHWHLTHVESY